MDESAVEPVGATWGALADAPGRAPPRDPARAYLASLSPKGRQTMTERLWAVAVLLKEQKATGLASAVWTPEYWGRRPQGRSPRWRRPTRPTRRRSAPRQSSWPARAARGSRTWPATWGVSEQALRGWRKRADGDAGGGQPGELATAERDELRRLRRENQVLRQEREILRNAAAFFAQERR